jgi:hypothetical protein
MSQTRQLVKENVMGWIKTGERLPMPGAEVQCRLKHAFTGNSQEHRLKCVDEDDCNWRTADDGSEIDYSWTVIEWFEDSSTPTQER